MNQFLSVLNFGGKGEVEKSKHQKPQGHVKNSFTSRASRYNTEFPANGNVRYTMSIFSVSMSPISYETYLNNLFFQNLY